MPQQRQDLNSPLSTSQGRGFATLQWQLLLPLPWEGLQPTMYSAASRLLMRDTLCDPKGQSGRLRRKVRVPGSAFPRAASLQSTASERLHCWPNECVHAQIICSCCRLVAIGLHFSPTVILSLVSGACGLRKGPWSSRSCAHTVWLQPWPLTCFSLLCVLCSCMCTCEGRGLLSAWGPFPSRSPLSRWRPVSD